jgi:trans-aconitate 2-methyltransferase
VSWDPAVYDRFAAERARPFDDLVARIGATAPGRVVDLGCGTGALTCALARRWPGAEVLGVDASDAMLARAAEAAAAPDLAGRVRVVAGDVRAWRPDRPVDVLVTNAVLQWVPDHLALLGRWVGELAPGGWLAVQVPANGDAPSHAAMRDLAARPPFADLLADVLRHDAVPPLEVYAAALAEAGCAVDAWETTYLHILDPAGEHGDDAVLAWVSGTGLRPILDALADDHALRRAFVDAYAARLRAAYPRRPWGTPLPFRRRFCVARAPG